MNNGQNIKLYQLMYSVSSFMFEMYDGQILPKEHPDYYDNLIDIKLIRKNDNTYGHILIGREEYQITDTFIESIQNYIKLNINKMIELSLKQNFEAEEYTSGGGLRLNIKYKSVLISIDEHYTIIMDEQDQKDFYNFKNNIINTIKNMLDTNK